VVALESRGTERGEHRSAVGLVDVDAVLDAPERPLPSIT
jgi:hypothetical protein